MTFLAVDKRGRNTLPDEVRRDLGIGEDDTTLIILEKTAHGTYELIPAALIPRDQLWFHDPAMKQRIAAAESDFQSGRSTSAARPEDAQAVLDSLKKKKR